MNSRARQDAESAISFLRGRGVERLVHFTSLENVPSILKNGLIPRENLDALGAKYEANDDIRLDGKGHINLSISHPNIPLFFKMRRQFSDRYYVVLSIDLEVLYDHAGEEGQKKYQFSNTNAASNYASSCNIQQLFAGQRPEGYKDSWTTDPQAEVLIPGKIEPRHINAIMFPLDCEEDEGRVRAIKSIERVIKKENLPCKLVRNDAIFDDLRKKIASASSGEKLEYYYLSWQANESAYNLLTSEIENLPSKSFFGSIAVPTESLTAALRNRGTGDNHVIWTLEFHKPKMKFQREKEQLVSLAVVEKIINRSRIGVLSETLEAQIYKLVCDQKSAWPNTESFEEAFHHYIRFAHQVQCTLIELVKHQSIGKESSLAFATDEPKDFRLDAIFKLALDDLISLSNCVCDLYKSNGIFDELTYADNKTLANYSIYYGQRNSEPAPNEAIISPASESEIVCSYDPVQVQTPVRIYPTPKTLRELLHYIFRFDDFREGQYRALIRALNREDTIVLLPTGSGKSVVFQLLALITPGTAFIISPIVSLIEDQVQNLRLRGIDRIVGLTGESEDKRGIEHRLATGQYIMCYSSPERFQIQSFIDSVQNYARENLVSVIAIDEAHCVSEWGHDFRTSYLSLAQNCRAICRTKEHVPPLLALTGTASTSVLIDMKRDLGIDAPNACIKPKTFDRPELHYRIIKKKSSDKLDALDEILQVRLPKDLGLSAEELCVHSGDANTNSGIVFCQNVNGPYGIMNTARAIEYGHYGVWDYLDMKYPGECTYYCGGKPKRFAGPDWTKTKAEHALRFKNNEASIMVATKAFGMGIDKPNVRWIVHYGMPSSLESYYQEVGRAARDGKDSYAYLILSDDFPSINDTILDPVETSLAQIDEIEETKGKWDGDDISRSLYFHHETFSGIEEEMRAVHAVLNECTSENFYDKRWHVDFSSSNKNTLERAVYRLTLLGAFKGYAIEYRGYEGGKFIIEPTPAGGEVFRKAVTDNYLSYIRSYQSDSAFLEAAKNNLEKAVSDVGDDREFILGVLEHMLVNFTYKIIEEGRRRALMTILAAARSASRIPYTKDAEDYFRNQIAAYLTTNDDNEDDGIGAILYDATDVSKLLAVIENAKCAKEELSVSRQALRLLEDYPQHYGLYFILAALQALQSEREEAVRSINAMIRFGVESYGLAPENCVADFLLFLDGSSGADVHIEVFDSILLTMSMALDKPYVDLLSELACENAIQIRSLIQIDAMMGSIAERMTWTIANTKK